MKNVLICGIATDMGKCVYKEAERQNLNVVCGVDKSLNGDWEFDCPVYSSYDDVREFVDVIIDVSSPSMLGSTLAFAKENSCPLREGTTGYTAKQKQDIMLASESIPVFMSYNLSLGVNVMFKLCVEAAKMLKNYDIEIIEKYSPLKINTPGATTISLANELNLALGGNRKIVIGRTNGRKGDEICIHCIRGGSASNEHEILFLGKKEKLSLLHVTDDNSLYADGAIAIINFLSDKKSGYYTIKDYFETNN